MKMMSVGNISCMSDILYVIQGMTSEEKLKFSQCFNCKNLDACMENDMNKEDNLFCKSYECVEKRLENQVSKDFVKLFEEVCKNHDAI